MANVDNVKERDVYEHLYLNSRVVKQGESNHNENNSSQDKDHAVRDNIVSIRLKAEIKGANSSSDTVLAKLVSVLHHTLEEKHWA